MEVFTLKPNKRSHSEFFDESEDSNKRPKVSDDEASGDEEPDSPAAPTPDIGALTPANVSTPLAPIEDVKKKRKLQFVIRAYRNNPKFAARLEGISFDGIENMSHQELEDMLNDIRFVMSCSAPGSVTRLIVSNVIRGWEKVTTHFEFPTDGLVAVLEKDPAWAELMDEICLEYADLTSMSATMRGVFHVINTTYAVSVANQNLRNALPANHQKASPDLQRAFHGL